MDFDSSKPLRAGQEGSVKLRLGKDDEPGDWEFTLDVDDDDNPFGLSRRHRMRHGDDFDPVLRFTEPGIRTLTASRKSVSYDFDFEVLAAPAPEVPTTNIALVATGAPASQDEILWNFISQITERLRFEEFHEFVRPRLIGRDGPRWYGTDGYRELRRAAEDFVQIAADPLTAVLDPELGSELSSATVRRGIERSYVSSEGSDLAQPFLRYGPSRRRRRGGNGNGNVELAPAGQHNGRRVEFPLPNVPFVELIWNYWLEEGMLVQSMSYILARFQNRRLGRGRDTLARLDLNPLLPLRNLLWGFVDDERRRLTVRRRAAEYEYQYGLRLLGRAVPPPSHVVERRTQFIEAFHGLLNSCHAYFKERDDKTVDADAFPLLSSLREVHLVLARGAHNQFADLPATARSEMLTMQWTLAQPEMREFLGGPTMVPYEEPWMDRVDTMKTLNGWSDASITHFFELAVTGEQVVLSIRHGRWNESTRGRDAAANWAITWRDQIQRYIHAYRTVTGVDLASGIDATMPSDLLASRLDQQARRA